MYRIRYYMGLLGSCQLEIGTTRCFFSNSVSHRKSKLLPDYYPKENWNYISVNTLRNSYTYIAHNFLLRRILERIQECRRSQHFSRSLLALIVSITLNKKSSILRDLAEKEVHLSGLVAVFHRRFGQDLSQLEQLSVKEKKHYIWAAGHELTWSHKRGLAVLDL